VPYIKQSDRDYLKNTGKPRNAGELNYLITLLLIKHTINYESINHMAAMITLFEHVILKGNFYSAKPPKDKFGSELHDLLHTTEKLFTQDILGAFKCAWSEFYRRKVAPYEDQKMVENGDVY